MSLTIQSIKYMDWYISLYIKKTLMDLLFFYLLCFALSIALVIIGQPYNGNQFYLANFIINDNIYICSNSNLKDKAKTRQHQT